MHVIDDQAHERQCAKLRRVRAQRDDARVRENLRLLESAARGSENLLPAVLDCVRSYATLGEMCDTLRAVFGEYKEPLID